MEGRRESEQLGTQVKWGAVGMGSEHTSSYMHWWAVSADGLYNEHLNHTVRVKSTRYPSRSMIRSRVPDQNQEMYASARSAGEFLGNPRKCVSTELQWTIKKYTRARNHFRKHCAVSQVWSGTHRDVRVSQVGKSVLSGSHTPVSAQTAVEEK